MEKRCPEKFSVRSMNQRVRSKYLLQRGKRSARSKQQPASCELRSLLLRPRCKLPDCPASQPPRLGLHSRKKLACLPEKHLFRRVIRLPEFIRESIDEVNPLLRQHDRRALFNAHRHNRGPPRMHAKPKRCLF